MPNNYFRNLILILLFIIGINFLYFLFSEPGISKPYNNTAFEYAQTEVDGALQPLPTIISIDHNWRALGKALFNSPLLSHNNTISCASCHNVRQGGDDGFPVSIGINSKTGARNSPSVLNATLNFRQFWDGRESSLKEQVSGPIHNPIEMGSNYPEIIGKLSEDTTFSAAFFALDKQGVTQENIINAIVTYENSLITINSPIDKYLLGDAKALSEQQIRGLEKFKRFGCIACHQGRNIGGNIYQKVGRVDLAPEHLLLDKGRFNITNNPDDLHVFKVPSLRNVALTAPYFHDGLVNNLADAVKIMGRIQLGMDIPDQDVDDIVALLHSFTGSLPEETPASKAAK